MKVKEYILLCTLAVVCTAIYMFTIGMEKEYPLRVLSNDKNINGDFVQLSLEIAWKKSEMTIDYDFSKMVYIINGNISGTLFQKKFIGVHLQACYLYDGKILAIARSGIFTYNPKGDIEHWLYDTKDFFFTGPSAFNKTTSELYLELVTGDMSKRFIYATNFTKKVSTKFEIDSRVKSKIEILKDDKTANTLLISGDEINIHFKNGAFVFTKIIKNSLVP